MYQLLQSSASNTAKNVGVSDCLLLMQYSSAARDGNCVQVQFRFWAPPVKFGSLFRNSVPVFRVRFERVAIATTKVIWR